MRLKDAELEGVATNLAVQLEERTFVLRETLMDLKDARKAGALQEKQIFSAQTAVRSATAYIQSLQQDGQAKEQKAKHKEAMVRASMTKLKHRAEQATTAHAEVEKQLGEVKEQLRVSHVANEAMRQQLHTATTAAKEAHEFLEANLGSMRTGGGGGGHTADEFGDAVASEQPAPLRPCPNGCGARLLDVPVHVTTDCPCRWRPCVACGVEMEQQQL